MAVLLEGDPDGVAERAARLAGPAGHRERAATSRRRGGAPGPARLADGTVLRIAFWASRLAGVLAADPRGRGHGGRGPGGRRLGRGRGAARGAARRAPPDEVTGFVTALRPSCATAGRRRRRRDASHPAGRAGTSVVVLHAPPAVREAVDVWGPVPSLALMRAVKDQFDPEHRMAPGRFAGGI